jgi:hypothetical protein
LSLVCRKESTPGTTSAADIPERAATRDVDDWNRDNAAVSHDRCIRVCVVALIEVHDVRPRDLQVKRKPRAEVPNPPDLPTTEQIRSPAEREFIAQPITHRQVRTNLPFILRVTDVVCLTSFPGARGSIVERARRTHIAEKLHLRWAIVQELVEVGERVCGSAEPVDIQPERPDLDAEFHVVIGAAPAQVVDERNRVVRIRLPAAILSAVRSDESAQARRTR